MRLKLLLIISFILFCLFGCYINRPFSEAEKLKIDIYPILNSEQKEQIMNLQSVEYIEDFIDQFWKYTDPNSETNRNELRDEYELRVEYVKEKYPYKFGWKHSDRARVYLIYGPPDDIQFDSWNKTMYLTGPNIQAIEIWTYDVLAPFDNFPNKFNYYDSHLMTFIFADYVGSNRYFQIYSNVPGEYSNPDVFPSFENSKED